MSINPTLYTSHALQALTYELKYNIDLVTFLKWGLMELKI